MTVSSGEQIGQYTIEGQIGTGGMATVYKAHQPKLDRFVAVKVMHPAFLEDPTFHARFQREARIIASLDHAHIVPVYDFDDHGKQPYLVMKFVEGRTLKQIVRSDEGLSSQQIVDIMRKIASALTYAHSMGVLHRDVKPSNIIIDLRGEPYLMDFGLARIAQAGESTMSADMMLGTPQYISPEQAQGKTNLTAATDVYSLGIVLYELLVGRVPFVGESTYAIVHDHIYSPLPLPSEINPEITPDVEDVLLKALAKNPAERYETANALIADYQRALAGEAVNVDRSAVSAVDNTPPSAEVNKRSPLRPPPLPPMPPAIPAPFDNSRRHERRMNPRERREQRRGRNKPPFNNMDEEIRYNVEEKFKLRTGMQVFGVVWVLVTVLVWTIWFLTGGNYHPWPIYPMLGMSIPLFIMILEYYNKYGAGADRREEQFQREIERERQRLASSSAKIKNDDIDYLDAEIRLTGDGELTDSYVDELENRDKNQYR